MHVNNNEHNELGRLIFSRYWFSYLGRFIMELSGGNNDSMYVASVLGHP